MITSTYKRMSLHNEPILWRLSKEKVGTSTVVVMPTGNDKKAVVVYSDYDFMDLGKIVERTWLMDDAEPFRGEITLKSQ